MILICEPQCTGFEHVEVNTALILGAQALTPDKKVVFLGEEEHIEHINKKLTELDVKNVELRSIEVPTRNFSNLRRASKELKTCRQTFELAKKLRVETIIFASVTSPGLYAIKFLLRLYLKIKCLVIPHNILQTITYWPKKRVLGVPFWFRFALCLFNLNRLRYLVLGPSIKTELIKHMPKLEKRISAIHLPYTFGDPKPYIPFKSLIVRFGAFGMGDPGKGTELLFQLANEIDDSNNGQSEFILIGHIKNMLIRQIPFGKVIVPSPDVPLTRQKYNLYAESIDYALYFYNKNSYELTASGCLLDAFSYLKPIIALRNPFFEYYFKHLGDIGYLCDNYEEMKTLITDLINNKSIEQYNRQSENLLKGRQIFSSQKLGEQLTTAINMLQ